MSLKAQLASMKAASAQKMPSEALEVIQNARRQLEGSGLLRNAANSGDNSPDFNLQDHLGQTWSLESLRRQGPIVLTFFRGVW